ncbi:MAG: SAV_6107 family HEPN domain-containing protein [Nakamurella sp.]
MLADAQRCLDRAMASADLADRYAAAHLGALRGASAVLASLPRPVSRTIRNASAWVQLERLAPEYATWAAYFAAGSAKRRAAEAGMTRLITREEADELIRQTGRFLALIDVSSPMAA